MNGFVQLACNGQPYFIILNEKKAKNERLRLISYFSKVNNGMIKCYDTVRGISDFISNFPDDFNSIYKYFFQKIEKNNQHNYPEHIFHA